MTIEEYQHALILNYNKNLECFKKYAPSAYRNLLIEDEDYSLEIMENGDLNISKDGKMIYPYENVMQFFDDYLETYFQRKKNNIIPYNVDYLKDYTSEKTFGIKSLFFKYNAKISQIYKNVFNKMPMNSFDIEPAFSDTNRYCMLLFGVGLGYHIPKLIEKYSPNHLVLIDTNWEMIKSSLYTLNWEEIFDYFINTKYYRTLEIIIDNKAINLENSFSKYIKGKVPLSYYDMWYFISYDNDILKEAIARIQKNINLYTGRAGGFYDDEKWSLQHTIHNLNSKIPLLTRTKLKLDPDTHIFIVANGPSLDKYMGLIKKHKDKAIVIAAGSALGSLYKNGVKPDFLIEIERTIGTYHAIENYAPKEFLKDIILIGMNNLHPRVVDLFKKVYMFNKVNDTGALFIKDSNFPHLMFSNPTVANGALAIAAYLECKNISFFGMDFGYKSEDEHHSKDSIYYKEGTKQSKKKFHTAIKAKGIYGDEIYTDFFYDSSRKIIEKLLGGYKKNNNVKVYNFSEGAYIEGTICVNENNKFLENLSPLTPDDYRKIYHVIDKQFRICEKSTEIDYEYLEKKLDTLKELILSYKYKNINSKIYLDSINVIALKIRIEFLDDRYLRQMLTGSIIQFLGKIYIFTNCKKQDKDVSKFINKSLDMIGDFIEEVKDDLKLLGKVIDKPFQ